MTPPTVKTGPPPQHKGAYRCGVMHLHQGKMVVFSPCDLIMAVPQPETRSVGIIVCVYLDTDAYPIRFCVDRDHPLFTLASTRAELKLSSSISFHVSAAGDLSPVDVHSADVLNAAIRGDHRSIRGPPIHLLVSGRVIGYDTTPVLEDALPLPDMLVLEHAEVELLEE